MLNVELNLVVLFSYSIQWFDIFLIVYCFRRHIRGDQGIIIRPTYTLPVAEAIDSLAWFRTTRPATG